MDLSFNNNHNNIETRVVHSPKSTDHALIEFVFGTVVINDNVNKIIMKDLKNFDPNNFKENFKNKLDFIYLKTSRFQTLENKANLFINSIIETINEDAPKKTIVKRDVICNKEVFDDGVKRHIKEMNQLYKIAINNKTEITK